MYHGADSLNQECILKYGVIRHFHIAHNRLCLPPKILHTHCFKFLLGRLYVSREIRNKAYAKFWGQTECIMGNVKANRVYYGQCENGEYGNLAEFSCDLSRQLLFRAKTGRF